MDSLTSFLLYTGIIVVVILIVTPLRIGAGWLIKNGLAPVGAALKTVLHLLITAHVNVGRNFQPRGKVIYHLDRKRTSYTEETRK